MKPWLSLLFPPSCFFCNADATASEHHICCNSCFNSRARIQAPYCETCHHPFYGNLTKSLTCSNCKHQQFAFNQARSALKNTDSNFSLIRDLKYRKALHLAPLIAEFCSELISTDCLIKSLTNSTLVPVPLHYKRRISRGFNQAAEIAKHISKQTKIPTSTLLKRIRSTETQTHLKRSTRQKNLKNAFKTTRKQIVYQSVILIDDVFTTGSTVNECAAVLRRGYPKLQNIVVVTAIRG